MNTAEMLLDEIRKGKIRTPEELEVRKIRLAEGDLIKNSQILELLDKRDADYEKIRKLLQIKNVRTASGVANIAVMWLHGESCPGKCIYCPQGQDASGVFIAPKSYTGIEPTTLRAIRNGYDPYKQVANRIKQLNITGHPTDKCELIIMGGTFMATPAAFREEFVRKCLDAFNGRPSVSLEEAQKTNETAENRCIGLTIETRADFCTESQIDEMLRLGATRVEIGVQTTDDDILRKTKRGHDAQANIEAIRRLKENGLKVCAHWMPGLTGLNGKVDEGKEVKMFKELFTENYSPDELKIYPTLVIGGTEIYEMWKAGTYAPLTEEQMMRLLIEFKKIVPRWTRIKRVMRDISEHRTEAGAKTTNLRQLAKTEMEKRGIQCNCIRCREVGHVNKTDGEPETRTTEYAASGGKEYFIEYGSNALFGFLRLRTDNNCARVRELHVYGSMVPIGTKKDVLRTSCFSNDPQHTGIGKMLLAEAEKIAKENGFKGISVTSGVGARDYYRKLGYVFRDRYMVKKIQ